MIRLAMKDVVLTDGTRIPRGTLVAAPAYAMHHDSALFADAATFDAFRFARMRSAASADEGARHQFTSTSPEYLAFGHGPHAWCVSVAVVLVCPCHGLCFGCASPHLPPPLVFLVLLRSVLLRLVLTARLLTAQGDTSRRQSSRRSSLASSSTTT